MNGANTTVLVVDDHTIVRQGLCKLLEDEANLKVVGEAKDGREAVRKVEDLQPDVVLMDISMPSLNGVEATRQIKKTSPRTKVIILSMHSDHRFISELFSIGASGYLLKNSTGADIIQAIAASLKGETFLSPSVSKVLVDEYVALKDKSPEEGYYGKLSNREREVLQLIAEGRSTKDISNILCVSQSTIKTHRSNIMEKLHIENMSQLVQFAIRVGLVDVEVTR